MKYLVICLVQKPRGGQGPPPPCSMYVYASNQASGTQVALLLKRWGRKEELNCYSWRNNLQSCQGHQTYLGTRLSPHPKNKIAKLLKDYQNQHKYKNMKYKKSLEDRNKFEKNLTKVLDKEIIQPDEQVAGWWSSYHPLPPPLVLGSKQHPVLSCW